MISSIWVHNLVAYSLQVALVVGCGALFHRLFRPRISSATLAYWQALLLACLLLPLCQPWKASGGVSLTVQPTVLSTAERAAATSTNLSPTARSSSWPVQETLLAAVVAGIAGRACWLVLGSISLFRLRRRSLRLSAASYPFGEVQRRLGIRAVFYTSDRTASPITFGLLRPVIILPRSVLAMETLIQEAIACHELLHVRRRDWIFEVIEECIRALLWFHPAIWWLIGRIRLSREQIVDRAVIHFTQSREQYVDALLTVALAKSQPQLIPAPLFLRRRLLKQRVAEILKESSMSKLRLTFCLAAISCLVLMAGAASVRMFPLEVRAQQSGSEPVQVVSGGEHLLHGDRFEYPKRAIERRIEGDVVLELGVDEQGHVYDVRVLSGPEELRRAALESALQWHYSPAMGVPVRTQATIRFKLPDEDAIREGAFERAGFISGLKKELFVITPEQEEMAKLEIAMLKEGIGPHAGAGAVQNCSTCHAKGFAVNHASDKAILRGVMLQTDLNERSRKISELEQELASKNTTPLQKKELEKALLELQEVKLVVSMTEVHEAEGLFDGTRRLSAISTERISESTRNLLLPRLGIRVGDPVSKESLGRVERMIQEFDEHFRLSLHAADDGGVILVILAP